MRSSGRAYVCRLLLALCLAGIWPVITAADQPAEPRPDPDACALLSNLDLEPLLFGGEGGTLDSTSNHPAPGMSTCLWEARPQDRPASDPPRTTTLAYYHLANRDRARAQLAAQPHGPDTVRASLAIDGRGDDELVRSTATVIVARHGADEAVLDARGSEISDPEQMELRYLLDALALKAAGATVKLPPWAKPGQTARWVPLLSEGAAARNAEWTPPANPRAVTSVSEQWLLHLVLLVLRHPFLMLFGGIFGPVAIGAVLMRKANGATRAPTGLRLLVPFGIAGLVVNLIFGNSLADRLLYRVGVPAVATITGSYGTSTQYNNHDVVGYHVLLRPPGGDMVSTSFEDDDFNVYPPHNATSYPSQGDIFTVRYLPRFPGDFTIVSDDGSPWAHAGRCEILRDALQQARSRVGFSHAAADEAAVRVATTAATAAGCDQGG